MTLRDLLTALEEEGTAEHEKAQRDRRRQAAQIIAEAREHADRARSDALATAEAAARQEAQTTLAAAHAGARRASRTAREDALERVHDLVVERLLELHGNPAATLAAGACLDEALAALPDATTVHLHSADVEMLGSRVSVRVVADLTTGGAIVEDDVGRYIDNTYLTRLASVWPDARVRLSRHWDQA